MVAEKEQGMVAGLERRQRAVTLAVTACYGRAFYNANGLNSSWSG
jgi:hypothetical protein